MSALAGSIIVRPLGWSEFDGISHWLVAEYYRIEEGEADDFWLRLRQMNGTLRTLSRHGDLDAAKAAAQAHFEARIKAAIVSPGCET